jgi:nitroimidazol reductase NimA-like FMN-containing flavoprotein (pyridoxamine 5'-phosphate oxidase superfamily)
MTASTHPTAEVMAHSPSWDDPAATVRSADEEPTPWPTALAELSGADDFWLGTVSPDGMPHVVPLLAVVVNDDLHFSAGDRTRKARNLAEDPRCVLTTNGVNLDLVVEGSAEVVSDEAVLHRVADEYTAKYDWRTSVRDGALWADGGAPTAGPPPYRVYRVRPATGYGLPTREWSVPTRWRFPDV